ncbi:DNA alkylation repair protein [Candidatus Saccharibacteria bacterium]|nr:DNA alkylation repair protein [Candidatus Saccharibacteria bacterium]
MTHQHDYLLDRILCIEQKQLEHEKFFARIFSDMDFEREPTQKIFFNGQVYAAHSFLVDLIKSARQEITLIDGYIAKETLDLLANKRPNVLVRIFTHPIQQQSELIKLDIRKFNAEHPRLEVHKTKEFHDRFLILDRQTAYHVGASLKDAGKRCFAITKLEDPDSVANLISWAKMPYNTKKMSHHLIKPNFDYASFRSNLAALAEEDYCEFVKKGIPNCDRPFLGVRIPKIRTLVKQLPSSALSSFLVETPTAFEEVLARGMAISRLPYNEMLAAFDSQLPFLDNWCSVDTFCSGLRSVIKGHENDFYDTKIEPLLESNQEFLARAGLVFLLNYYINFEYLSVIFGHVSSLANRDEYYVKMAIAWLLAECYIALPEATLNFLKTAELPKWTFNKTISKICDSYRVSKEDKAALRALRK